MPTEQNYANHVRYFPLFHFVLTPLLTLNMVYQAFRLYQDPSVDRAVFTILSIAFLAMITAARLQALKVHDRVIRLEERLRYADILPRDVAARSTELSISQVTALRFASDEELAGLFMRIVNNELKTGKDIKLAIKDWRGDHLRA